MEDRLVRFLAMIGALVSKLISNLEGKTKLFYFDGTLDLFCTLSNSILVKYASYHIFVLSLQTFPEDEIKPQTNATATVIFTQYQDDNDFDIDIINFLS